MKLTSSIAEYILEKLAHIQKEFPIHKSPCVFSCGGIYIPRRKSLPPSFQVLNLANEAIQTKVYVGRTGLISGLQEVLVKASLN